MNTVILAKVPARTYVATKGTGVALRVEGTCMNVRGEVTVMTLTDGVGTHVHAYVGASNPTQNLDNYRSATQREVATWQRIVSLQGF